MKAHRDLRRIFIVDAHPVVHEGVRRIINNQDDLIVCGEAFNVSQALELFETLTPDLVMVDIALGDIYLSEPMKADLLASVIGRNNPPSKPSSGVDSLSPREFEVFRLIGKGNSTRQIAQQLYLLSL